VDGCLRVYELVAVRLTQAETAGAKARQAQADTAAQEGTS
jgi:hypothetical protein